LSTELADITEVEYRQLLLERVVLVSVWTSGNEVTAENSIAGRDGWISGPGRPDSTP
jgi:GTPase